MLNIEATLSKIKSSYNNSFKGKIALSRELFLRLEFLTGLSSTRSHRNIKLPTKDFIDYHRIKKNFSANHFIVSFSSTRPLSLFSGKR